MIMYPQGEHSVFIVALSNNAVHHEAIEKAMLSPCVLQNITFEADICLQQEEFFYLTDLAVGKAVDASLIIKGLEFLNKKKKFSVIKIALSYTDNGVTLHYYLDSFWILKKIKIRGVFQEKHIFSQSYLINKGDVFSHVQHNHSIVKIKKLLEHEGYCANKVTATFEHDERTKEVTVCIHIAKGKRFIINKIAVEMVADDTNNYEDVQKNVVKKLSHALLLQKYKKDLINRQAASLHAYLSRKGYQQIGLELKEVRNKRLGTVDLIWKLTVLQERSVIFFGNRFFSKKELLEKILAFGRSAWLMPATLLAEEIFSAYKNKGFWNAQVVGQEEKGRSFFVIQEGIRAIVKSVEVRTNQLVDGNVLRKSCFSKLLHNKYYDFQLYHDAIKLIRSICANKGFLNAVVIDSTFVPTEKEGEYSLIVTVDEGRQSYITSVIVEGYSAQQLQGPFKRNFETSPLLFDTKIIEQHRAWLVNYFQKLGYVHPYVKSQINMKDYDIHVIWTIDPGEKVCFGKTITKGNVLFPFEFLMKFIDYEYGDKWDQEKIRQTFKRLKDLDIFESISFTPDVTDKTREKAIILNVHFDDTYEVRARAGLELQHVQKYQTFNGLTYKIGGTGIIRNPFNVADLMRLDLDFAASHREIVACYRRPLFFKKPLMFNIQMYSISYDQPGFIGSINDIYTLAQNGISCSFESKIRAFEYGFTFGCEGMATKIKDPLMQKSLIAAIDFQPQLVGQLIPFFFIEPTIMFEHLDNALNPTSGYLTLCSLKGMIPFQKKYKNTLFVKVLCEQSFFLPLGVVIAALRIRFGHIFYRKLSSIMPSERFYLGGSHSLRGYEADLAPPLGVFVDEETKEHIVPRGGKSMLNINAELRFPLYKKIGGVIFQDFGILSGDTFDDFKPQNFLASTGFGARFYTPLGPLRFDIGWRWKKQTPLERSFAWFLTFGQAF